MQRTSLIAEQLTSAEIGPGRWYELWATPEMKEGFRLYLVEKGIRTASHPYTNEVAARKDFERRVEAAVMGQEAEQPATPIAFEDDWEMARRRASLLEVA
jgi:hypothetical protein